MRTWPIILLLTATAAGAQEQVAQPDPVPTAAEVKAMQGRTDPAVRKAVAEAVKAEPAALPYVQSQPAFSSADTAIMTAAFIEAKVPDCLHSEGLKRQPTFLLTGYLALPFIAVAKLRGVCI